MRSIDASTLVAAPLKQSCRAEDDTLLRWSYELRMGDTEAIALDNDGRLVERRASDGTVSVKDGIVQYSGQPTAWLFKCGK